MILLLVGCAATVGPNLLTIQSAIQGKDVEKLVLFLEQGEFSYIRERAAEGLRQIPMEEGKKYALPSLRKCIQNQSEKGYVRAQCGLTLGGWGIDDAAQDIIEALDQVDDESRYWLAVALRGLSTPDAKAQLQELTDDPDVYLSTSVRQWLETAR